MRILTLLTITELLLGGAGLTASWLLISSTQRLQDLGSRISNAVESIYVTEQAERALLVHNRESYLYAIRKEPEHLRQRAQAERELNYALKTLNKFAESPRERELLEKGTESVALYLKEREGLESQGKSADVINTSILYLLEDAEEALGTLMQINYEQAQNLQVRAQEGDAAATTIGFIAGAGVLLILGGAFFLLHHGLRRPLLDLRNGIAGMSSRTEQSEIPPKGPTELREITEVFNGLIRRANSQRESQLRFLAGVAHDIRTPLNAIKLSTEFLDSSKLDQDERSTLDAIKRQVSQLNRQVGDLLDTSRVESGHLDLKINREDLRPIVEHCVQVFKGWSERHSVTFTAPDSPVMCACDATRIGQVVNNLISNALKYSPSGGDVLVVLSCDADYACVEVNDQGIGIAPEDLRHIFEPFRRTRYTRETIPGVGLGLSVSRKIAEAHKGSILVTSTRGVGSTFTLRLPLERGEER